MKLNWHKYKLVNFINQIFFTFFQKNLTEYLIVLSMTICKSSLPFRIILNKVSRQVTAGFRSIQDITWYPCIIETTGLPSLRNYKEYPKVFQLTWYCSLRYRSNLSTGLRLRKTINWINWHSEWDCIYLTVWFLINAHLYDSGYTGSTLSNNRPGSEGTIGFIFCGDWFYYHRPMNQCEIFWREIFNTIHC